MHSRFFVLLFATLLRLPHFLLPLSNEELRTGVSLTHMLLLLLLLLKKNFSLKQFPKLFDIFWPLPEVVFYEDGGAFSLALEEEEKDEKQLEKNNTRKLF